MKTKISYTVTNVLPGFARMLKREELIHFSGIERIQEIISIQSPPILKNKNELL